MKDLLITTKRQKTELKYLIASFLLAFCLNICAILIYHTAWRELYTQWFPMLALTIVIYFLLLLIRLLFGWIAGIITKKRIKG
jgi:hypothetical protein